MLARVPDDVAGKDLDISAVRRIRWKEGRALQVMHVGPYEQVGGAYE